MFFSPSCYLTSTIIFASQCNWFQNGSWRPRWKVNIDDGLRKAQYNSSSCPSRHSPGTAFGKWGKAKKKKKTWREHGVCSAVCGQTHLVLLCRNESFFLRRNKARCVSHRLRVFFFSFPDIVVHYFHSKLRRRGVTLTVHPKERPKSPRVINSPRGSVFTRWNECKSLCSSEPGHFTSRRDVVKSTPV